MLMIQRIMLLVIAALMLVAVLGMVYGQYVVRLDMGIMFQPAVIPALALAGLWGFVYALKEACKPS